MLVHRYPAACKAFYMKPDPADPRVALCVDVLAPEGYGEIIGGGQREDDLDDAASARSREHDLPQEAFEWYLDLRRYGSVPHAGFGMGIERVVAWICGLQHVRETIPFPRMLERLRPSLIAIATAQSEHRDHDREASRSQTTYSSSSAPSTVIACGPVICISVGAPRRGMVQPLAILGAGRRGTARRSGAPAPRGTRRARMRATLRRA